MSQPQKKLQPAALQRTAAAALPPGLTAAHFTERELSTLRLVCRDADNELASRMLRDALARAESKS